MGSIVCATRGGEASRRTQERAISLAKERDADLTFLCVVDPGFVEPSDQRLRTALEDELRRLGRSLLCIVEARADEQDVEARTVIRCGPVRENLEAYLRETGADTLVIGAPAGDRPIAALDPKDVDRLAEAVRESTGVEVIVVE
jgi:nucleotide-binding universal stress UspA family protein